ncbi:hypothetical protein CHS0354_026610 [Potamilus streckersoni]|uniref:Cytochrome P450 n=1 Tax=Potamilus streckersoni TaxID=2493646 RepID=A0AAE0SVA5_9BIVA|nr:hypothetical protein CHS0354_026610 [Potamilus streckersoni]
MYITISGLTLSAILGLLILTLFAILFLRQRNQAKMLPGPAWIPLVGNISELRSDPDTRISLRRLQKKYGNIYKLYLGLNPSIIVCGYDTIREIFIKRGVEFSDRPAALLWTILLNGAKGITAVSGHTWKNQRKFTLLTLRNYGFGRSILEDKIHTEVKLFLSEIEKANHEPFQMMASIETSVGNVISHVVFGGYFNHEDPRFKTLMDGFNSFAHFLTSNSPVLLWPILRFVPGDFFGVKTISRKMQEVKDVVNELIEEHMKKFDDGNIEDFVDAFISEMKKKDDREKTSIFTKDYLAAIIMDLFFAGMETTSTTITWASFYLATRRDIQNRIFEEIKTNVGMERFPSMQDKKCLVYTGAFIMEVLRMSSIVILSIPHAPVTDVSFQGYHIPKGMLILPDIHSVLSDPKVWGDPENFRPERFISEEGKLMKPDEFIPFFTGRRNCLGESLAKMELLLFISALVQRFELMPSQGEKLDIRDVDGIFGATHAPKPFNIRAISRHDKA